MNKTEQNGTVPENFTSRQLRAIAAILDTDSMDAAAQRAHVGRTTLYAWLRNPVFRDELKRRQGEVFDVALGRLKSLAGNAIKGLGELLEAKSESVKRSACRDILDAALKVKDLHDMDERLATIEKHLKEMSDEQNANP